jgi:hypothetical protein
MWDADGNAPLASSAAAPPRSLKLSDSTPTLMPEPLTLSPLSSSACCTCAAVAPPEPTWPFVWPFATGASNAAAEFARLGKSAGMNADTGEAGAAAAACGPASIDSPCYGIASAPTFAPGANALKESVAWFANSAGDTVVNCREADTTGANEAASLPEAL